MSIFIIFTYFLNQRTITSHQELAQIINISGKQRMLSQRLIIVATNYLHNCNHVSKQRLLDTIKEIEQNNQFLLQRLFIPKLHKIFYDKGLNENLKTYINYFKIIADTEDISYLKKALHQSQKLLIQLDQVVKIYEKYSRNRLQKMSDYEFYVMIVTLFVLILEVIFIYRPAAEQIEKHEKSLQEKIQEQTKKLQETLDLINKHVIFSKTNPKGNIIEVSDAFCEFSGYTREELLGNSHNMVRHPDMSKYLFKDLWDTIKEGKVWKGEIKNRKKDGSYYWVDAIISPEYDNGILKGYAAIRHDITAKKDFEEQSIQLMQAEKLATLGEMIGNIAHQWRQPLSAISSTASSMQVQYELGIFDINEIPEQTKSIIEKTNYLSETINTFRDFITNDKTYKELIIQDEIKQAINITSSSLKDNQIKLINNIDYDNPIKFKMVSGELPQVIVNIINNAKDILLERKVENAQIVINLNKKEDKILITIEDNAGGIPEKIIGKIFEPYFTTKHQSQGTGLGLHMSYQIIHDSLNGDLYVKNTLMGAKFFIELPLEKTIVN